LGPALSFSLAWALIQRTGLLAALIHSPKVYNTASVKVVPNGGVGISNITYHYSTLTDSTLIILISKMLKNIFRKQFFFKEQNSVKKTEKIFKKDPIILYMSKNKIIIQH
jgi:hypothetical protein